MLISIQNSFMGVIIVEATLVMLWVVYGAIIAVIGMGITHASEDKAAPVLLIAMFGGAALAMLTASLAVRFSRRKVSSKDPDDEEDQQPADT